VACTRVTVLAELEAQVDAIDGEARAAIVGAEDRLRCGADGGLDHPTRCTEPMAPATSPRPARGRSPAPQHFMGGLCYPWALACESVLAELLGLLRLERLENTLFRGQSQDLGWGAVFGGQVLGQALSAAQQTVPGERQVHSFHGYFLRSGDVRRPIIYDVECIRDGKSFTTRRVVAIQNGQAIFSMSASFQAREPGFEHHAPMPEAPDPEGLPLGDRARAAPRRAHPRAAAGPRPRRQADRDPPGRPGRPAPTRRCARRRRMVWFRAADALPDDPALHCYLLAYASDFHFMTTAMQPHGVSWLSPGMHVASLDHAMWFHAPLRLDEWLLYAIDSPAAVGRPRPRPRLVLQPRRPSWWRRPPRRG
jgi:acyl-CoA thioesterase-2